MRPILTLAVALGFAAAAGAADTKFALNGENTTVKFVGSKPDGKHEGGFKSVAGSATVQNADPSTLKLDVVINTDSLYSDDPKLTAHLKSPDFFGVKQHPKATFVSTKVAKTDGTFVVTGDLTLCGKTKSISFPAKIGVAGGALKLDAAFKINRADFGMTFGRDKINDAVALTVSVNAK